MTTGILSLALGVVICALSSVLISALREYSLVKLEERLKERGDDVIEDYRRYSEDEELSILSLMLLRGGAGVTTVLAVGWSFGIGPENGVWNAVVAGALAFALVTILGTTLAELVAAYFAEAIVVWGLPLMAILNTLLRPLTLVVQLSEELWKRILGAQEISEEEELEDEIMDGLAQGARGQIMDAEQAEMIKSIFDFHETDVRDIMTPRTDVVMIQVDTPLMEAVQQAIECGHSRIPVFGANRDEIVGILYVKDLLKTWLAGASEGQSLRDHVRKPFFVPQTRAIGVLLREMRGSRIHLAVILDEYGGCAGIVTIEDIVEEIIGDIQDEHDDASEAESIVNISEGVVECSGLTHIEELSDALDIPIEDNSGNLDTVGGYVFSHLGQIPEVASEHVIGRLRFNVLAGDDRRINRLRIEVLKNGES